MIDESPAETSEEVEAEADESCRAVLVSSCMRHTPSISRVPNNTEISPEEKLKTNAVKKDYSISNGKQSIQC